MGHVGSGEAGAAPSVTRLLGLTLLLPACGADFLWVDTMGKKPELVTTTTTSTTTTTAPAACRLRRRPVVRLPPPPRRPGAEAAATSASAAAGRPSRSPLPGDSPLTGIGVGGVRHRPPGPGGEDRQRRRRPAPAGGINEADVVFEEMVEGGFTRFAAVYHSTPADPVGPIRSARSTDVALLAPLYHPLFSYSGANRDFKKLVRESSHGRRRRGQLSRASTSGQQGPQGAPATSSPTPRRSTPWPRPTPRRRRRCSPTGAPGDAPVGARRPAGARGRQATWVYDGKDRTTSATTGTPAPTPGPASRTARCTSTPHGRKVAPTNVIFQFVHLPEHRLRRQLRRQGARGRRGRRRRRVDPARPATSSRSAGRSRTRTTSPSSGATTAATPASFRVAPGWSWSRLRSTRPRFTDRPVDANDEAKPVAPPLADGTGPSPPETTTTTTGPASSTTTTEPEETTTTAGDDRAPRSRRPRCRRRPSTPTRTRRRVHHGPSERKSQGKNDSGKDESAASASTSSASVAAGPASAAVIGLLLLLAPGPAKASAARRRRVRR